MSYNLATHPLSKLILRKTTFRSTLSCAVTISNECNIHILLKVITHLKMYGFKSEPNVIRAATMAAPRGEKRGRARHGWLTCVHRPGRGGRLGERLPAPGHPQPLFSFSFFGFCNFYWLNFFLDFKKVVVYWGVGL